MIAALFHQSCITLIQINLFSSIEHPKCDYSVPICLFSKWPIFHLSLLAHLRILGFGTDTELHCFDNSAHFCFLPTAFTSCNWVWEWVTINLKNINLHFRQGNENRLEEHRDTDSNRLIFKYWLTIFNYILITAWEVSWNQMWRSIILEANTEFQQID